MLTIRFIFILKLYSVSINNIKIYSQTTLSKNVQNRMQSKRAPSFGETVENAFKMSDKRIFRKTSIIIR